MAHVAKWKYKEVEDLKSILKSHSVIGIAEIGGIPAPQLQQMRKSLREIGIVRVTRNTLLLRALEELDSDAKGIKSLSGIVKGQAAVIATDINPFKLFRYLKETKTNAPAKGGETAISDIVVKAGETPFKPGPVVGELQKAGIPAAIEGGKVVIKKDKIVVPAGEKIPPQLAQMLTRLEIYPIEIGIKLNGAFEGGNIFTPDVLDIDMEKFLSNVKQSASNAYLLALSRRWINPHTIIPLISKAYKDAFSVAMEISYPTKEVIEILLARANSQALALSSKIEKKKNT